MAKKAFPLLVIAALIAHLCIRFTMADDMVLDFDIAVPSFIGETEVTSEASYMMNTARTDYPNSIPVSFMRGPHVADDLTPIVY